jgi:hypothetical protein
MATILETFEGALTAFTNSGTWTRTTARAYNGTYSFRSAVIGHSATSTHNFDISVPVGAIRAKVSLYYYTSTENNYDWLKIYLNGVLQVNKSGANGWTYWESGVLSEDSDNNLQLVYSKDGSATAGDDAVYIDQLQLTYTDPSFAWYRNAGDTLSLADSITPNHTVGQPPTDGWDVYTWNNAFWDVILKTHTVADNAVLADSLGLKTRKPVADTTTLSEGFTKKAKPNAGDTTTVTDSAAIKAKATLADTLPLASTIANKVQSPAADTLSLADAIQAKAKLQIAEALGLLDALTAAIQASFADSVSVGDEGIPRLMVLFEEAVSVSDSILALFQAVYGDSLAINDLLANRTERPLGDDAVTSSDGVSLKSKPSINDTVALADSIATAVAAYRSSILNLADQLSLSTKATQSDTLNLLDAIATEVAKKDLDSATSLADDLVKKWASKFVDYVGSENRVPGFEHWTLWGGAYVDPDGTLQLPNYGAGATSPMVPIERGDWTWSADFFSADPRPGYTDQGGLLEGTSYYAANGSPAYNGWGYTGNGDAQVYPINTWSRRGWGGNGSGSGGKDIAYLTFSVQSNATYTAPSFSVRNPMITTTGTTVYSPYGIYDEIANLVGGKSGSDSAATADAIVARVQDYLDDFLALVDSAKAKASDVNADTTAPTDALAIVTKRLLADTLSLADAISNAYGTGALKPGTFDFAKFDESNFDDTGDPVSLEDAIAFKKGYGTLSADLLALADAIQVAVKDVLTDSLSLTDSTAAKVKGVEGDTLPLSDSKDAKTDKDTGDTSTVSDTIVGGLDMPRTAGDSAVGLSDSSSLRAEPKADDTVSLSDNDEGKTIGPGPGDTTGVADIATFSFKKNLDDLLVLSDDLLRSVAAIVGDTTTVGDQLAIAAKAVAAEIALNVADDNKLKVMTLLGDLLALSDNHIKTIAKAIDDVGTVNDALTKRIGAVLNSIATLADTLALSVTMGVVNEVVEVSDSIENILRLIIGSSFDMAAWDNAAFDTTGDLVTISDSITLLLSLALADNLAVDDGTKAAAKLRYTESINLVDSLLSLYDVVLDSNLSVSDTIGLKNMRILADTVALADSLAAKYDTDLQDAIIVADDLILKAKVRGEETVDLQDAIDLVAGFGMSANNTITLSDTNYAEVRKQLADTLSLVDTFQTKAKLTIDEAIVAADIIGVMTKRSASDTIALMDEIARLYRYILGGSWDSVEWGSGQFDGSGDYIQVDDGYRFALSALLQDAITTNDSLKAEFGLKLADTSDIMDQVLNGITKAAAETMGVSDDLLQLIVGLRNDTSLSLAELLSKRTGLPPDDSSMVADSITASLKLARSANDLIAATDNAVAKVKAMLRDVSVLTDSFALSTKRAITEAFVVAEALGIKTQRPITSNGVGLIDELYLKYALGIAWDDTGIADSIKGKVKTLLLQVFINGISIPVNGLNLRHSGKDRVSTATFKIPSPNAEILNLAKQRAPVNIYLVDGIGNTDYFGGRIIGNPTSARGSITTEMDITVDDWTAASLDVYVSESCTAASGTISEVLKYLWQKYYGYSINLDKVVATTKRMPTQVFNYVSLFEVTERLAQLLGWSWHVEWNGAERVLQFYPPSAAIHPVTLSRESKNIVAGTARFGQDDSMANVVYVFGGQGVSNPYTQKIVADGQNTIYKLGSKPYRLGEGDDGGIQVNLIQGGVKVPLRVGIQNLHDEQLFDVMLDFNEGTLRFRDNNIPIKDAILEAIYRYMYPIMVQLTDDSSIQEYGRIETSINDTSLIDVVAARELGRAILRDRAYPKGFGSCEVFVPGLRAGQFITVDLPAYNTKGLFEITEIEKWIQGGVVRRRVTLNKADNAESRIAQRLKEFAKRLANLESSNRQEDMVVQRWLQGPANIGTRVTGNAKGQIEDSATDNIQSLQDDYVLTWKTTGRSKTWAKDSHPLSDDFAKKVKPKYNEVVTATSKITGGITFFDTHTFGDSSHPFGL